MMPLLDYYAILEVPSRATLAQVKQSYRRLVRRYHPDLNKQTQDTRIKQLNEAYEVLSDMAKRAAYDALLLEQLRATAMLELLRRQQFEPKHEVKMTWTQGITGFFRELKKEMQDR